MYAYFSKKWQELSLYLLEIFVVSLLIYPNPIIAQFFSSYFTDTMYVLGATEDRGTPIDPVGLSLSTSLQLNNSRRTAVEKMTSVTDALYVAR